MTSTTEVSISSSCIATLSNGSIVLHGLEKFCNSVDRQRIIQSFRNWCLLHGTKKTPIPYANTTPKSRTFSKPMQDTDGNNTTGAPEAMAPNTSGSKFFDSDDGDGDDVDYYDDEMAKITLHELEHHNKHGIQKQSSNSGTSHRSSRHVKPLP